MKRWLPISIVVVVAILDLAGGAVLYRNQRALLAAPTPNIQSGPDGGNAEIHARGPGDAPVTLIEFGDYQCPPCGALAEPLRQIEKEYGSHLRVIFRNFPFPIHAHAQEASLAAEAAGLQGRFWEMHDLLYREQAAWSKVVDVTPLFASYAGVLGLDVDRFVKDMSSKQVGESVARDQRRGVALGVKNTPTIFINDRPVQPSSLSPDGLRQAIREALNSKAGSG